MYFWNILQLKEDIRSGDFGEKDRFIYAFIYIALATIGMEVSGIIPLEDRNIWDNVSVIGNILIPIIGTIFAYRANGGRNGRDFLGRFFSIGFVLFIRFLVLLVPIIMTLFGYYIYAYAEEDKILTSPIDVAVIQTWLALLYIRTCKHMADVSSAE